METNSRFVWSSPSRMFSLWLQVASRLERSVCGDWRPRFCGSYTWPWNYCGDCLQTHTFFPSPVRIALAMVPQFGSVVVRLAGYLAGPLVVPTLARVSAFFLLGLWLKNTTAVQFLSCFILTPAYDIMGRDGSVGIATGYGLDGESRWGEIFLTRPDRPWGPPGLLYNGYRVFPGGKTAGVWCWPLTPF
jgi:hypothetical protein